MYEFDEIPADKDDQLRQLLSYCEEQSTMCADGDYAYADVRDKLAAILDGEE